MSRLQKLLGVGKGYLERFCEKEELGGMVTSRLK